MQIVHLQGVIRVREIALLYINYLKYFKECCQKLN